MDSDVDSSAVGGSSGLFDFSGLGDKSAGDVWTLPGHQQGSAIRSPWRSQHMMSNQPSPAVPRSRMESKALKRKSGATELIKKSLAALDEVVSAPSLEMHTRTPGSLLKESFRANRATPITHKDSPTVRTPVVTGARQTMDTPQASLSIMDETGLTRELYLATPRTREDDTVMDFPRDQTFLNTTLFDQRTDNNLEDPVDRTSRDLVTSFHECYSNYNSPADSLELINHLQEACEKQVQDVTTKTGSSRLLSELLLERSMWELISVLYSDRVEVERMTEDDDMATDVLGLKSVSDKETADEFFIKESSVRQAQLVVDWLEKNAVTVMENFPVKVNYFADSVCWENTLHNIQRKMDHDRIVSEMDPDAPRRQERRLAELDEKDEQSLVKHLFTCIRAGKVTKAQELCVQCGQSWRAATLEGWKLHHDSNYGKNVITDDLDPVEGNVTRDLWKISAWELANDPNYNHHERAIYAALSGNIKHILPACNNWLDYVWAYFKVMVDVLTEQRLRGFSPSTGHPLQSLPTEYWNALLIPELIFQEIEASHSTTVRKDSQDPFHVAHKFIILGNLDGLISVMHGWLVNKPNLYQLRFMAHLVLFAQGLGEASSDDQMCSDILEAYVKELTKEKFNTFIALYTARLPRALQISCYADLLEDIVDPENQRRCLELGNEAGLDIAVITKSVVEHMRNTGTDDIVTVAGPELVPQKDTEITQLDKSKIEVIKWLVYDKGQRAEALKQGNALMRQFLATRKLSAANALFNKIPSDSVDVVTRSWNMKAGDSPLPDDLANDIHEYRCIQTYLECHTSFNDWFHHYHHYRPEAPPEPRGCDFKDSVAYEHKLKLYQSEEETWTTRLQELTKDAEDRLYSVLLFGNGGWMVDQAQSEVVDERREKQLQLLREVCIPQTTFLLHTVLDSTQQTRKSLQLADIVASEDYQLYKVFRQHELQRLLALIHKTASFALSDRHSEIGYPL